MTVSRLLPMLALLIACGDDPVSPPPDYTGAYSLNTVSGAALPATVSISDGTATITRINGGLLRLVGDGLTCQMELYVMLQVGTQEPFPTTARMPECEYSRVRNALTLDFGLGGTRTTTVVESASGRTITFDMGDGFGVLAFREQT